MEELQLSPTVDGGRCMEYGLEDGVLIRPLNHSQFQVGDRVEQRQGSLENQNQIKPGFRMDL
jgi:hypothetical protein